MSPRPTITGDATDGRNAPGHDGERAAKASVNFVWKLACQAQYRRSSATSLPCTLTLSAGKIRVS